MSPEPNKRLNPKRAAQLLVYDWIMSGGQHPKHMTADQMDRQLKAFSYKVTEERRDAIVVEIERLVEPLRLKLANDVQTFAII